MNNIPEKTRNYTHEYNLRKKKNKRLHADMKNVELVEEFQQILKSKNITFVKWLEQKIKEEITGS
jgi:ribonuclease HI